MKNFINKDPDKLFKEITMKYKSQMFEEQYRKLDNEEEWDSIYTVLDCVSQIIIDKLKKKYTCPLYIFQYLEELVSIAYQSNAVEIQIFERIYSEGIEYIDTFFNLLLPESKNIYTKWNLFERPKYFK